MGSAVWDGADDFVASVNEPWVMLITIALSAPFAVYNILMSVLSILSNLAILLNPLSAIIPLIGAIVPISMGIASLVCGILAGVLYQLIIAPAVSDDTMTVAKHVWLIIIMVISFFAGLAGVWMFVIWLFKSILGAQPIWDAAPS
ncbi:MAG: hypothetical protein ACTSRW_16950 [Candidatus Helarchaeota archaeon]